MSAEEDHSVWHEYWSAVADAQIRYSSALKDGVSATEALNTYNRDLDAISRGKPEEDEEPRDQALCLSSKEWDVLVHLLRLVLSQSDRIGMVHDERVLVERIIEASL
jgi:hypothetical protein